MRNSIAFFVLLSHHYAIFVFYFLKYIFNLNINKKCKIDIVIYQHTDKTYWYDFLIIKFLLNLWYFLYLYKFRKLSFLIHNILSSPSNFRTSIYLNFNIYNRVIFTRVFLSLKFSIYYYYLMFQLLAIKISTNHLLLYIFYLMIWISCKFDIFTIKYSKKIL